jgi:hypothetical protein
MNEWTTEEITKLKENWTAPPDMGVLRKLIGRSSGVIYDKARELNLPKISRKETFAINNRDSISEKKEVFLENYKLCRYERQALRKTCVAYSTVHSWLNEDSQFRKLYEEVKSFIDSTKKCVYCRKVDVKEKFRNEKGEIRNQWKTGICRGCDSKRIMKQSNRL